MAVDVNQPASERDAVDRPNSRRRLMGGAAVALLLGLVALIVVNPGGGSTDDQPQDLSDFTFTTTDEGEMTLADFEGSPLVVNYFAAWCGPCRAELPAFERTSRDVAADGVTILGVSRDSDEATWKSFIAETEVTFQTVFEGSGDGSFQAVGGLGMPTTVFVRPDGSVAHVFTGALPEDTLRQKIDQLVSGEL